MKQLCAENNEFGIDIVNARAGGLSRLNDDDHP
jgi:hypothetical protein